MGVTMGRENTVLDVNNLYKNMNDFKIRDISFSLEAGYIMGFIGRNGAGKTTVMKLIQNVIVKQSGTITVCGYDNRKQEIKAKNQIGFVADDCPFLKHLSLMENATLFGKYYKAFDMKLYKEYLKKFDLDERKNILTLSKGMESRFQLAFALAHRPKLLIMDEPTDGLDPIFRREFLLLLQELIETEEMSILFSTHITSDLDKVADYITMIDNGELVFSKDKESLMDQYVIMKGNRELKDRIPKEYWVGMHLRNNGLEGMVKDIDNVKKYIKINDNYIIQRATLQDVMYYYCKGSME